MNLQANILADMGTQSDEAAAFLRTLASGPRLLVLCHLSVAGELSVGALVERVGLSQSALSQHLAKLREQGLIAFRREAQTLIYRIADERAAQLLEVLHKMFCPQLEK
tara:strand:- start:444 stop:767 length:324 start_codon:yes stop_codon:yes gene_type:complete